MLTILEALSVDVSSGKLQKGSSEESSRWKAYVRQGLHGVSEDYYTQGIEGLCTPSPFLGVGGLWVIENR